MVDDGSEDCTAELVRRRAGAGESRLRLISHPHNRGKGAAVRTGMLAAEGDYVVFSDADGSTPIAEVDKLLRRLRAGADVVIGSRALPDSDIRLRQHPLREWMGRSFNAVLRVAAMTGFGDTQCGFKGFTATAARDLFGQTMLDGFAFDVEVLLLARKRGYRIEQVPVVWANAPDSKVGLIRDSSRMLFDVVRLRLARFRNGSP